MDSIKKITFLLLLVFATSTTFAQKQLDSQDIEDYLDLLQKEQIITEFGKDALIKGFKDRTNLLPTNRFPQSNFNLPDSLFKSRSVILCVLGIFEIMRNVGSAADELIQYSEVSEKLLGERMLFKPEIDATIDIKKPETILAVELGIKNIKKKYLSIAQSLEKIGLIDKKVLQEGENWLKRDRIILLKDFSFFIYLARQTWYYDNYETLKKEQISLIDSLTKVNVLDVSTAASLKNSYQPFELKTRVEILSKSKSAFQIPIENGNFTREELYLDLFRKIKSKLLPELQISNFKILEKQLPDLQYANPPTTPLVGFKRMFQKQVKNELDVKLNGLNYRQLANTDFGIIKTIKSQIPPDIHIDSTLISRYSKVFSSFIGFTTQDIKVINDYLTDIHSKKRLFIVSNTYNPLNSVDDKNKVVILLDSTQYQTLSKKDFVMMLTNNIRKQNFFDSKISRDSINHFISSLQSNGIIKTVQKDSLDNKIVRFRAENNEKLFMEDEDKVYKKFLFQFDDIVTKSSENQTFKTFINELSRVSGGNFNPVKIEDNIESENAKGVKKDKNYKYSFKLGSKVYEASKLVKRIEDNDDEYVITPSDNEWIELVNKALAETQGTSKFYKLPKYTENKYILLTETQFKFIEENYPEIFSSKKQSQTDAYEVYQNAILGYDALKLADSLKSKGMIAAESYDKLKSTNFDKKVNPSDVFKYSKDAFVVDLKELKGLNNFGIYKSIITKINDHLQLKNPINFHSITKLDSLTDGSEYLVEAEIDNQQFRQKLYVSLHEEIKKSLDSLSSPNAEYYPSIGENQFKIVNDYLNDSQNPKRMVIVCDYKSSMLSFVFFDSTQAHLVQETLPNNYVDFEMYNQDYSRKSLKEKVNELISVGFLNGVSEIQVDSLINIYREEIRPIAHIFEIFPNFLTKSIYSTDEFDEANSLKIMLNNLSVISNKKFLPTNIEENTKKILKKKISTDRIFKYSFEINDKKYEGEQLVKKKSLNVNDQEGYSYGYFVMDESLILNEVNKSLEENNIDGKFHKLTFEDSDYENFRDYYVYLSARQYRYLKEHYPEVFSEYYEELNSEIDSIEEKDK